MTNPNRTDERRPRPGIDVPYTKDDLRALDQKGRATLRCAKVNAKPGTPTGKSLLRGNLDLMLGMMRDNEVVYYDASVTHVPPQGNAAAEEKASAQEILGNSPRDAVLHGALKAVSNRDNEAAYGTGNSFDAAARIKAAILSACHEPPSPAVEIAITQIAVKLARLAGSGFTHEDSAVDLCGYTAWAFQLATDPALRQKI